MAEVNTGGGGKGDKKRSKKASTKIDMTAMVDVGFLLITFFMLTTTLSKPKAMELVMPDKDDKIVEKDRPPVKCSNAITIVLAKDHKVYWYECPSDDKNGIPDFNETNFSPNGIRKVLIRKGKEIGDDKFVAVIKPLDDSKYVDMVGILDEMKITNTKRYAIVDVTEDDRKLTEGL